MATEEARVVTECPGVAMVEVDGKAYSLVQIAGFVRSAERLTFNGAPIVWDDEKLTRAEWEEIQRREWAATRERLLARGDLVVTILLTGADQDRQTSGQIVSLIDAKLEQARKNLLRHAEERREALKNAGR